MEPNDAVPFAELDDGVESIAKSFDGDCCRSVISGVASILVRRIALRVSKSIPAGCATDSQVHTVARQLGIDSRIAMKSACS